MSRRSGKCYKIRKKHGFSLNAAVVIIIVMLITYILSKYENSIPPAL